MSYLKQKFIKKNNMEKTFDPLFGTALGVFISFVFYNILWIIIVYGLSSDFKKDLIDVYFKSRLLSIVIWIINISTTFCLIYTATL